MYCENVQNDLAIMALELVVTSAVQYVYWPNDKLLPLIHTFLGLVGNRFVDQLIAALLLQVVPPPPHAVVLVMPLPQARLIACIKEVCQSIHDSLNTDKELPVLELASIRTGITLTICKA